MRNKIRLIILTLLVSIFSSSCWISVTPVHSVEVQNNSEITVIIFEQLYKDGEWHEMQNWGEVKPGEKRFIFTMVASKYKDQKYHVEARDSNGNIINRWEFPYQDRVLLVIDNTTNTSTQD